MKRIVLLTCLALMAVPLAFGSGLCTDDLGQNVLTPGFSCTLGPFTFQNFSASAIVDPNQAWTPAVYIAAGVAGNMTGFSGGTANLYFQTNFNSPTSLLTSFRDITFTYEVVGPLYAIDAWIGGQGNRTIAETACTVQGCNGTGNVELGELTVNDLRNSATVAITPSSDTFILKDISLGVKGDTIDIASMSEFSQSFTVPEPLTMILVGSGLLGLGLLRRRRRS